MGVDPIESKNTGIVTLRKMSVTVETESVRRYYSSLHLTNMLSKAERSFLEFVTENMNDHNIIANNQITHHIFNNLLKRLGIQAYSSSTIHKCFSALAKYEIIYPLNGKRGLYAVNPLYFYKGTEEQREKAIREMLEEPYKVDINKIRHKKLKSPS